MRHAEPSAPLLTAVADVHSHILPGMDDGAADASVTRDMLDCMAAGHIRRVVATPHFYATEESPASFLSRRKESIQTLLSVYDKETHPLLFVGAEVAYLPGFSSWHDLSALCVAGTHYLLLEMPESHFSERETEEVATLSDRFGITPVIAHVERCLPFQKGDTEERLLAGGVLFQTNAGHILDRRGRKDAHRRFRTGHVHLVGSDAHNMTYRRPNLPEALLWLKEESDGYIESLEAASNRILSDAVPIYDCL